MIDYNNWQNVFIIIILIVSIYIVHIYYDNKDHEYVKANNGKSYRVQIKPDNKKSANLLGTAIDRIKLLLDHLKKSEMHDIRTKTLINRFKPENITENKIDEMNNGVTSYTINKGESIVVCLRQKNHEFVTINTLMYVIIHELGHICDLTSQQHDSKFWENFEWLLSEAINIGVYNYIDYSEDEEPYCGITITSNIIDDKK